MDTSQPKSTATDASGVVRSEPSGLPRTSLDKQTILEALARLESEIGAFIETTDAYLLRLTDHDYFNIPGHVELGEAFAQAARFRFELATVRRRLE